MEPIIIMNTFLALVGSAVATFAIFSLVNARRLDPIPVQQLCISGP